MRSPITHKPKHLKTYVFDMTNETESGQELNATQLDAQRARNLLDRALGLAERDDLAGAIVMCRQSLALAPKSPQGWSMLGLLHERDGDIDGAIEAYEKTLQLSPSSTLERESLQRLRQKRGAAPRPAPKFNFEEISNGAPQVPSVATAQPSIPEPIRMDSWETKSSSTLWDTFYFRSLPVLVASVACLGLILMAQRVATNRQTQNVQEMPAVPTTVETSTDAPDPATAPAIAPSTLSPPATSAPQSGQVDSSGATAPTTDDDAPAPVIAPTVTPPSKPKAAVKPKPKAAPKAAPPSEMPVLPRPRLTLPKRPDPTPAAPSKGATNNNPTGNEPIIGGGPVDVGSADDSKYIPVTPPQFPNASRN